MSKPFSPASARKRDPILQVLLRHFGDRRHVLEIGAGSGQHAVHFAAAMPWLQWQASDHPQHLPGIRTWLDEAALPNAPPPIPLQAALTPTPGLAPPPGLPVLRDGQRGFDAIYSANTLHIMGWPQVQALFAGLPAVMAPDAVLAIYGPFNRNGQFTSESNRDFDAMLRERDPASGIRDAEAVDALAASVGLQLIDDVALPANNYCRVWRRMTATS
ncbi:DUF938 domain-containing protein [Xanthomonas vasicola]|uniref:DUF938 domain-containing protein n=1 Tax=Xanthomonas vasicola TaxID=56459 RepID=UPI0003499F64|nr:DUF938 domain-containing protein [Xanthomonas vasicola]KFA24483.1 hypothetical protein KW5_0119025 [Xanthomonas vasicola pv. vasculorum NCPPB 1326]